MARKTVKLTDSLLRKLIREEKKKLRESSFGKEKPADKVKAEELDADEYGSDKSLENPLDHMKALKIRENALIDALIKLQEAKKARAKKAKTETKKRGIKVETVKMNEKQLIEALRNTRKRIRKYSKK